MAELGVRPADLPHLQAGGAGRREAAGGARAQTLGHATLRCAAARAARTGPSWPVRSARCVRESPASSKIFTTRSEEHVASRCEAPKASALRSSLHARRLRLLRRNAPARSSPAACRGWCPGARSQTSPPAFAKRGRSGAWRRTRRPRPRRWHRPAGRARSWSAALLWVVPITRYALDAAGLRKGSGGAIPIRPSIRPSIRLWSGTVDGERLLPIRRYTAAALCAQLRGSVALRATTVALPAATRSHSACAAPQQSMTMRQGAPPQQHERAARRASHTSDDPIAIFRLASGHATSQLRPEGKGEWKGRLRAGSECGGVQSKRLPIRKPLGKAIQSFWVIQSFATIISGNI